MEKKQTRGKMAKKAVEQEAAQELVKEQSEGTPAAAQEGKCAEQEKVILKLVPTEKKDEAEQTATAADFAVKEKPAKKYAGYKHLKALYSDEQALNLLRRKIFQFKEIDADFLKKIEESNAYRMERVYVPVAKVSAKVRYSWKTKGKQEVFEHDESKVVEKLYVLEEQGLNATDFSKSVVIGDTKKADEKMVGGKKYPFKRAKKQFYGTLRAAKPNKKAKTQTAAEVYELIYVPVLKATCYFDGVAYVGYVNLVNGACISDYKISERLERAVDKTVAKVRGARQWMWSSFMFLLGLFAFSVFKAFYPSWSFEAVNAKVMTWGIWLAAFGIVPILGLISTLVYKRKEMEKKTVATGKLPHSYLAKAMAFFSLLSCAGASVLFVFKILV